MNGTPKNHSGREAGAEEHDVRPVVSENGKQGGSQWLFASVGFYVHQDISVLHWVMKITSRSVKTRSWNLLLLSCPSCKRKLKGWDPRWSVAFKLHTWHENLILFQLVADQMVKWKPWSAGLRSRKGFPCSALCGQLGGGGCAWGWHGHVCGERTHPQISVPGRVGACGLRDMPVSLTCAACLANNNLRSFLISNWGCLLWLLQGL